ncbi:MAG: hypothetical protein JXA71_16140, partial [Chitinispirillaceae bacterium]|nr:hypothetical protein [Chitinispirillaceae bacterium]
MRHSPLHPLLAHNTLLTVIVAFSLVSAVPVGDYLAHSRSGNTVDFNTGGTQKVRIYVCTPGIVRVSFDARGTFTSTKDVLSME